MVATGIVTLQREVFDLLARIAQPTFALTTLTASAVARVGALSSQVVVAAMGFLGAIAAVLSAVFRG